MGCRFFAFIIYMLVLEGGVYLPNEVKSVDRSGGGSSPHPTMVELAPAACGRLAIDRDSSALMTWHGSGFVGRGDCCVM